MRKSRFICSILMISLLGPCGHGQGNAQTPGKTKTPASFRVHQDAVPKDPAVKEGAASLRLQEPVPSVRLQPSL